MPNTCCVPGCDSGRYINKIKVNNRIKMFLVPKDPELLGIWMERIPITRKNKPLAPGNLVCALHFDAKDIIDTYAPIIVNGKKVALTKSNLSLSKNSLPKLRLTADEMGEMPDTFPTNGKHGRLVDQLNAERELEEIQEFKRIRSKSKQYIEYMKTREPDPESVLMEDLDQLPENITVDCDPLAESSIAFITYNDIVENYMEIEMPSTLWGAHKGADDEFVVFTAFSSFHRSTNKTVYFEQSPVPKVYFAHRSSPLRNIKCQPFLSLGDISNFLRIIDAKIPCDGISAFSMQFSDECDGYVVRSKSASAKQSTSIHQPTIFEQCLNCKRLEKHLALACSAKD